MSATHTDHAEDEVPHAPAHAFDSPEEVAHAKQHATENLYWFGAFFIIVLFAVANYEFTGVKNTWMILFLAAIRSLAIAFFLNYLFRSFSLVFRTLSFTVFFLAGMIFLSLWDSEVPHIGDPIRIPASYYHQKH